jgi:hypothetical protein
MLEQPVVFRVELDSSSKAIHELALLRAQKYLVAEAELLESIMDVDQHKIYIEFGETHLTPYCVKVLGLSEDVAAVFVRVARKSQLVPELKAAIDEGLSVFKAKTIASVVTAENQEAWIERAQTFSKDKLERAVAAASPTAPKPERAKPVGQDLYRVEFELTEEQMALFRRAQELASAKLKRNATLADTFAEMLPVYLDKNDPVRKADRSRDRSPDSTAKGSRRVPARIPAHVRHQVHRRDRGCCQARMPDGTKCLARKWTQIHHLHERQNGGGHTLENLTTLCSAHHRMWHAKH